VIVDPDFLDHWKTRMLVDSLGSDELAPIYIIRLWAHCQQRRMYVFDNLNSAALRAICRYKGDVDFESAMTACGYVSRDESGVLEVCGWAEYNATLIANWKNGKLGGRPRKEPKPAQKEPMDNPPETHGIPMANPSLTHGEPIRLDRIGEDKTPMSGKPDDAASKEVLEYLNQATGKSYRAVDTNIKLIRAKLDSGASVDDCKAVIDAKVTEWLGNADMEKYLRPETLFGARKFEQYLGQLGDSVAKSASQVDNGNWTPGVGKWC
jgi:uncharacterized phage protein (TIGR02220 family)